MYVSQFAICIFWLILDGKKDQWKCHGFIWGIQNKSAGLSLKKKKKPNTTNNKKQSRKAFIYFLIAMTF